jgi:hypothetical protein
VVEVPESASPLIVLINKRSGGQVGARIIQRLCRYLNPLQIFDLAKGGPAPAIRAFKVRLPILRACFFQTQTSCAQPYPDAEYRTRKSLGALFGLAANCPALISTM